MANDQQANETVTVKLPSGEEVDAVVPAGMTDQQVAGLMRQKHPEFFSPREVAAQQAAEGRTPGAVHRFMKGMAETLPSLTPETPTQQAEAVAFGPNLYPAVEFLRGATIGQWPALQAEAQKAEEAKKQGRIASELVHAVASGIPILGPLAGGIASEIQRGNLAGAAGTAAGVALQGKLIGRLAGGGGALDTPPEGLAKYEIPRSVGEVRGSPMLKSMESVAGKTAVGRGLMTQFLQDRLDGIQAWVNDLTGKPQMTPEQTETAIGGKARVALGTARTGAQQSVSDLAQRITNRPEVAASTAGDLIMKSVRGQFNATQQLAGALHEQVADFARDNNLTAKLDSTGAAFTKYGDQYRNALSQVASPIPAGMRSMLQAGEEAAQPSLGQLPAAKAVMDQLQLGSDFSRLSPVEQRLVTQIVGGEMPEGAGQVPFNSLKVARTGVRMMREAAEKAGNRPAANVLLNVERGMTADMRNSLAGNPDMLATWNKANALTRQKYNVFIRNRFIQSMVRNADPVAAEDVVTKLMQPGEETNINALAKALQGDARAKSVAARAMLDVARRNATTFGDDAPGVAASRLNASRMLNSLENRPGFRTLLGDEAYNAVKRQLQSQSANLETGPKGRFTTFLKDVSQMSSGAVAENVLKDTDFASQLGKLSMGDTRLRQAVAADTFGKLLDKATQRGDFGQDFTSFDPVEFAHQYRAARPALAQFVDPKVLSDYDQFAEGMRRLELGSRRAGQASGEMAGTFHTLGVGYSLVRAVLDALSFKFGGVATNLGFIYAPRMFLKIALDPRFSGLMARGLTMTPEQLARSGIVGKLVPAASYVSNQQSMTQPVAVPTEQRPAFTPGAMGSPPSGLAGGR